MAITKERAAQTKAILKRHADLMEKIKGAPEPGKQYRLTGGMGVASIAAGNTWPESEVKDLVKKCPACGGDLHPEEVMNSLSRYCGRYICSDCGQREAFEGDFWHGNALYGELRPGAQ